MNIIILLQLLLAHILSDFVIQTDEWVQKKNKKALESAYFWIHILLAGLLSYLFLQQWTNWQVPIFIIITHGVIDYFKILQEKRTNRENSETEDDKKKKSTTIYFFVDQLLHLSIIIVAWLYLINEFERVIPFLLEIISDKNILAIVTAITLIIWPVGIIIGKITEGFRSELSGKDSLSKAGKYIGIFERTLVFIFILFGQYEAIGFLIASKSILRIAGDKDKDARKKTEYVLIGTLISFTAAIIIGLLAVSIIDK